MAIVSHELKLVYFDVPKVACTTLKSLFWEFANGPQPVPKGPGRKDLLLSLIGKKRSAQRMPGIHNREGYRTFSFLRAQTQDIPENYTKITVVRDPIARFCSAWSNKANHTVLTARAEQEDLLNEGLTLNPDFNEYLEKFERFREISRSVRVHNFPYAWHLGPTRQIYDRVFRIENMAELEKFLGERAGRQVTLQKANRSSEVRALTALTGEEKQRLREYTRVDYEWLGDLYDQDESLARFKT